jgi:hypothetical protein
MNWASFSFGTFLPAFLSLPAFLLKHAVSASALVGG